MPSPGSVTNPFFWNYGVPNEQNLLEDLVIEAISIYGIDFFYIPRNLNNFDQIYFQDDISSYDRAIQIVCYVKSYEGFEGQQSFMSKFGLEIRDQITFTISNRVFMGQIGLPFDLPRPREGDLLYYPLNNKVFQIKFVENKPIHYPLGSLPTFDMYCELFEYTNEVFDTGIPEVDRIQRQLTTDYYDWALKTDEDLAIMTDDGAIILLDGFEFEDIDVIASNEELVTNAQDILDFTEDSPFGEI